MTTRATTGRTLAECEAAARGGWAGLAAVGEALAEIRDRGLYRGDFGSWDAYCQERFGLPARHVNRIVGAVESVRGAE